uniref:Uncharacterized protein n=1 Tax=Cucumis sativus TaxID=3659 RepID=A0A0A0K9A9_CUCSA
MALLLKMDDDGFDRESRDSHIGFDTEGTRRILANPIHSSPKRLGTPTFYERFLCGFGQESRVPHAIYNIEGTQSILAQSGLALLLSTSDFYVASAKSREFPMQFLIPKKFKPVAAWISYFLRAIMASGESQKFPTQRLRSPLFLGQLYCSFRRESRVLHTSFNIEGTRHILAWIGFALLLSTSDFYVASAKSPELHTHFLIPKEPDAFLPEAACLSFIQTIMASIESREFPI